MDRKEFSIYRIMKGHLSFRRDGLSLYIKEPDPNLLFDSIEVYDQFYDEAYGNGCYIKDEIEEVLYTKDLYSPFDDKDLEKYKKDYSQYWNAILSGDGEIKLEESEEVEITE